MSDPIVLTSKHLRATIACHGARLETLSYQGGASLTLHADPVQYPAWRDVYPGAIVGPVANRVAGGRAPVGGVIHQMPCNENGITALHSGPNGLDQRDWQVLEQSDSDVRLGLGLGDGDGGLPGNREITVRYALEDDTLVLTITAQTDAPTPINIAHHPYWRLGEASAHRLEVKSARYLPVNADNIPTGDVASVAGTPFDHRNPRALDAGVDHNFCLADAPRDTPAHMATLTGTDGLELHIASTEPGLQVYSGAHLPTLPGTDVKPFAGIALEPQGWPDAINQPGFPGILHDAAHPYRQITRYLITQTR